MTTDENSTHLVAHPRPSRKTDMAKRGEKDSCWREDLAWAAGILDGEGHFDGSLRETRPGHTIRGIRVSVPQTDPEMLLRLQALFGGQVRKRKPPTNPKHSQRWDWKVTGLEKVQALTIMVWPWLGSVKRTQALGALETWHSWRSNVA